MRDKYRGNARSGKPITYKVMEKKKRKYSKKDIARIATGIAVWIAVGLWIGPLGLMLGGLFALATAPKGFYVE